LQQRKGIVVKDANEQPAGKALFEMEEKAMENVAGRIASKRRVSIPGYLLNQQLLQCMTLQITHKL